MSHARNTVAIAQIAAQKRQDARERVRTVLADLEQRGVSCSLRLVAQEAHVSRTFLYDPKNADLAENIRRVQHLYQEQPPDPLSSQTIAHGKSDRAKDAQIARLQERIKDLEKRVRDLQQENQHLYGKLAAVP